MPPTARPTRRARKTPEQLDEYRRKRDFRATPEPGPGDAGESAAERFVVQEHSATRLHWDLRLERGGVAVSWAVPNGIPEVPGENRMAVHTEDHPLEYLEWEGVIPKGNYGAGTMKVWDRGTYETHEWTDSKVTATFHGERVSGRYHLFQIGGDGGRDWMIRRVDPPADPDRQPMPEHAAPVIAVPGRLPAGDEQHAYEIQWQGVRALAFCEPGRLRLQDEAGAEITGLYPELGRLTRSIGAHSAILDGELVALGADGRPDQARLERRAKPGTDATMRRRAREAPVVYEIYDLLYLDGRSLTALPWHERRARLRALELDGDNWRVSQHHEGDGAALLEAARANGLPGIVAKPLDSPYGPRAGWVAVPADEDALRPQISNPGRLIFRSPRFTKADMAGYYEAVAPVLLPHLHMTYEALMQAVEAERVELETTLAPAGGPPASMAFGVEGAEPALLLRGMFDQLGVESFAKTAAGNGLHVVVPLNSDVSFDQTGAFAKQVAELVATRRPDVAVDWSANAPGATMPSAYSLLAGKQPLVSAPVGWDEVESGELEHDPAAVLERVAKHGDLFAPVLTLVQQLP